MADKVVLASIASFQNDTSAAAAYNSNNALLTTALDNTLSRDGTSPNQMGSNLDMNNNQILNLPAPATVNSPARLVDVVSNPTITVPPTGTSGATVPLLNTANTWSATQTFPNNSITNAFLAQSVGLSVKGVTGTATANEAAIVGTTRQVLAVNTAGTGLVFAQPQGDQLLGTTTNDNATAGNIGEVLFIAIGSGSAVALATGSPSNMASISLTAGDWDVYGAFYFTGGATTTVTYLAGSLSTTSATLDSTNSNGSRMNSIFLNNVAVFGASGLALVTLYVPSARFSVGSTTTLYAVAQSAFGTSTCSVYGSLKARRVR